MKKSFYLILVIILILGFSHIYGDNDIYLNKTVDKDFTINVLSKSIDNIIIEANVNKLDYRTLKTDFMKNTQGEEFSLISLGEYAFTGEIGKPKLPMMTCVLDVPHDADIEIKLISADYKEMTLAELGIDNRIMPALQSSEKMIGVVQDFIIDNSIYTDDSYYPWDITDVYDNVKEKGYARGHRLATLKLFPVQYNPVKGTVRLYYNIKIEVSFTGGDRAKTESMINKNYSKDYEQFIERMVINYTETKAVVPAPIYYDIYYNVTKSNTL